VLHHILRLAIILLLVLPANAETEIETAKGFLETYEHTTPGGRQLFEEWVTGFEQGLNWADIYILESCRRSPHRLPWCSTATERSLLYCKGKLVLRGEQLMDILRREVEAVPDEAKMNWRMVMIVALQKTFPPPCKR
jgi:hypothetical protein